MGPIDEVFAPFIGMPSWRVTKGYGSFVTLEFGDPLLRIGKPTMQSVFIDGLPPKVLQRYAHVHGQWHLWIYCCDWSLTLHGTQLAHNESDDITIARSLAVLNGQAIRTVEVDSTSGSTRFDFDLDCLLTTTPAAARTYRSPTEQWMLFQPSGAVLTVRSDGTFRLRPGDATVTPADDDQWHRIPGGS